MDERSDATEIWRDILLYITNFKGHLKVSFEINTTCQQAEFFFSVAIPNDTKATGEWGKGVLSRPFKHMAQVQTYIELLYLAIANHSI